LGRLMSSRLTKKELAFTFAPSLISLILTVALYISYTLNPDCVKSTNASQCWDFRPLLIPVLSFLTLILILVSLYKYRTLINGD
jgi:hypothetical protein